MTDYLDAQPDFSDPAVASAIDEASLWAARFGLLMLDEIALRPGLSVLDLGCGSGFPLFELAHVLGPTCRFVGLDIWRQVIGRAAGKRRVHGLRNVRLVIGDGARLPLADAAFDLIVSNLGLNNFADPPAVADECARVLRPGGRLALTTNLAGHMREFYEAFRETLTALRMDRYLPRLETHEAHRGTKASVCKLLTDARFVIARTLERSFVMRYLDGSALLRHSLTRFGFLDGWRKVVDPDDERTVFAALERALNDVSSRRGELRMCVPMLFVEAMRPFEPRP
jgi:arsenite methyltransferase